MIIYNKLKQTRNNIGLKIILIICPILYTTSCKKLIEVDPPDTMPTAEIVYKDDKTAASVLTGIYESMMNSLNNKFATGTNSISIISGLSADELKNYSSSPNVATFYTNSLLPNNAAVLSLWSELYNYIYVTNSAIEGIERSDALTKPYKEQLLGEARFIRGFCYFYLTNLFGDVPLITSSDYRANSIKTRTKTSEIYEQIISDLKDAEGKLTDNYWAPDNTVTTERVRPNRWCATALLARVYLYTENWQNAEIKSSQVINNEALYRLTPLTDAFLKNSAEAIWQLQPVQPSYNTYEAYIFVLNSSPSGINTVSLSTQIVNEFEPDDLRKLQWVKNVTVANETYFYPYKYSVNELNQPVSEYLMVLRLAEQFLIRAEARAHLSKLAGPSGATDDINKVRNRAGLADTTAVTQASALNIIEHERQVELFTEWGHRWLDLKRTNKIDQIMTIVAPSKGGSWNHNRQLYPIPRSEMEKNPNLRPQNPGYQL